MHYAWLIKLQILPGISFFEDVLIIFEILKAIWDMPGKIDIIHK